MSTPDQVYPPGGTVRRALRPLGRAALVLLASALLVGLPVGPPGQLAGRARADDLRSREWQLPMLHGEEAWQYSHGSGVTVAVLDSGVDVQHPDLAGRVLPGIDLVDGSTDGRKDFVGHGTSVADLIAGRRDGDGVVGLAYEAKILPVRVLDANNRYLDATTVANGVRWAVDHGATVLNLSLGGAAESGPLADALRYAFNHDVVVVACAGNVADGGTEVWYPARASGVIAVSGLTPEGRFWSGSLSGPTIGLAAPADGLVAARPNGYWEVQGTSFAAPLVAASAALLRSRWPTMSAPNVVNRLISTADPVGQNGRTTQYGYGLVDPLKALTASVPTVSVNPLDTAPPAASTNPSGRPASPRPASGSGSALGGPALRAVPLVVVAVLVMVVIVVLIVVVLRRTRQVDLHPPAGPPDGA